MSFFCLAELQTISFSLPHQEWADGRHFTDYRPT